MVRLNGMELVLVVLELLILYCLDMLSINLIDWKIMLRLVIELLQFGLEKMEQFIKKLILKKEEVSIRKLNNPLLI